MHSARAVIYPATFAGIVVAGLPVVTRSILTLWSAGVRTFTVIGAVDPKTVAATKAALEERAADIVVHWAPSAAEDPERRSTARVVLAIADAIFAPPVAVRLMARGRLRNVFIPFGTSQDQGLRMMSASDYALYLTGVAPNCEHLQPREGDAYAIAGKGDVRRAERGLFVWCIKPTDGAVSRYLNRPISTWISRHLSPYDIQPRQLTGITALLALVTFMCLMQGNLTGLMLGCLLYHITSVVDGLDGEIARAKFLSTRAGAALDTAVDMASNLLFMIGLSLGCADVFGVQYIWMGTFIAATVIATIATMTMVLRFGPGGGSFDVLQITIQQRLAPYPRLTRAFDVIHAAFKRDLFAFMFAVVGLAGMPQVIPWFLALGAIIWLVAVLLNAPAMLRANREDILPPHLQTALARVNTAMRQEN